MIRCWCLKGYKSGSFFPPVSQGLKVTMKKDPSCFKLNEPLKSKNEAVTTDPVVLYDGKLTSDLCLISECGKKVSTK